MTRSAPKLALTTNEPRSRSRSLSACAPMPSSPLLYRLITAWLHVWPVARATFAASARSPGGGSLEGVTCCVRSGLYR